jgi:hypothetical protein
MFSHGLSNLAQSAQPRDYSRNYFIPLKNVPVIVANSDHVGYEANIIQPKGGTSDGTTKTEVGQTSRVQRG